MHRFPLCFAMGLLAVTMVTGADARSEHRSNHIRHGRHRVAKQAAGAYAAEPGRYGAPDGKPDCRYPDGTPFDPDIIGGPNHVGAGGPAVNLGGFDPCGY